MANYITKARNLLQEAIGLLNEAERDAGEREVNLLRAKAKISEALKML